MAFFCPGAAHGSAKKKPAPSSKPTSLSQGTSPLTPVPPSSLSGDRGGKSNDLTLTLPHSNTQCMKKKLIVVQKYEPKPGNKGLAVNRGETVLLVRDDGGWLYVKNESGVEGFVPRSHLLSPSRTRTRTMSRSGTTLRQVASNGSVPMHSTQSPDNPPDSPTINPRVTSSSPLSLDDSQTHHSPHPQPNNHTMINGHCNHHHPPLPPPRVAAPNEILYDHHHKYSPSSSSGGITSFTDPYSPGMSHSPMVADHVDSDRGREQTVQSSDSSLNHSHDSYGSSSDQGMDHHGRPSLISPLNHIEGGREGLKRARGGGGVMADNVEDIPRSNSISSRSTGDSSSSRQTPVLNGIHYIDKTTNHIYSTLEPTSPPPPPLPPRNMPTFSASQDPTQNVYAQLEQNTAGMVGGVYKTCSQEALIHPSHCHNSYSEGWARDRKIAGQPVRSGSAKSRLYKEVVEIQRNGSPRFTHRTSHSPRVTAPHLDRQNHQQQHLDWRNQTKITKFRKTVWGVFVVTHDFDPLDENEIPVRKGEHVSVWNRDDQDWFWVVKHASSGSEEGFVPSGCLREVSAESKTSASIRSGSSAVSHSSTASTSAGGSPRIDDINTDPMHLRRHSQDSRHSNSTYQSRPPRPSSGGGGGNRNNSQRERRNSESNSHVHRVHNRDVPPLSLPDDPLPPSSPPPPYSEIDTNRRFISLSQQPAEAHHSQPSSGYSHGMQRTRSQGHVTSRSRAVHYPNSSPSSPHGGDRRGEGRMFHDGGGTLV